MSPRPHKQLTKPHAGGVDPFKEIGSTLEVVEETQLLTKLAKTGLLSKAERAGVKLADLEPLLLFAEENGLVGLLGDLNDDLLPLLPLLVRLAPLGLPVLSLALGLGPLNFLLAIASFGAANRTAKECSNLFSPDSRDSCAWLRAAMCGGGTYALTASAAARAASTTARARRRSLSSQSRSLRS